MDEVAEVLAAWEARGRRLEVPGAATRVWQEGDGEPVVCLHGVPASAFTYRKMLPALAGRGRRAIAFDFPGLGLAERPVELDYSWSGLAQWTLRALDALELERFHLVVHDIGGPIGFEVIARAPQRVSALTVLNTPVRVATFRPPPVMRPFTWAGVRNVYLALLNEPLAERLMRLQGVASAVPSAELRAYTRLLKRGDGGRAFLRIMAGFELTRAFEERTLGALAARTFPAQVVWGEQDTALTVDRHGEDARQVLGLEGVTRLPGKHFVQEDAPEELSRLVAELS